MDKAKMKRKAVARKDRRVINELLIEASKGRL